MTVARPSEKRCPTCGAELQRFTSRLHCPACNKDVTLTSKTLSNLEAWISSDHGRVYSCTRQYPHPGYACDYRGATCVGCLIVAAALELRKAHAPETECVHPAEQLFYHGGITGNLSDYRCNLCQKVMNLPVRAWKAPAEKAATETPAVVQKAAQHWLDLQRDIPIAWEGGIDAAMLAACNEIRRLSATPKAFDVPARDEGETPEEYRRRLALFGVHAPPEKASAEERLAERWPDA